MQGLQPHGCGVLVGGSGDVTVVVLLFLAR